MALTSGAPPGRERQTQSQRFDTQRRNSAQSSTRLQTRWATRTRPWRRLPTLPKHSVCQGRSVVSSTSHIIISSCSNAFNSSVSRASLLLRAQRWGRTPVSKRLRSWRRGSPRQHVFATQSMVAEGPPRQPLRACSLHRVPCSCPGARTVGGCVDTQRLRRLHVCCCRLRLAQTVVATFSPGGPDACYVLDVQARCFSRGCVRAP